MELDALTVDLAYFGLWLLRDVVTFAAGALVAGAFVDAVVSALQIWRR